MTNDGKMMRFSRIIKTVVFFNKLTSKLEICLVNKYLH